MSSLCKITRTLGQVKVVELFENIDVASDTLQQMRINSFSEAFHLSLDRHGRLKVSRVNIVGRACISLMWFDEKYLAKDLAELSEILSENRVGSVFTEWLLERL